MKQISELRAIALRKWKMASLKNCACLSEASSQF